MTAGEASRKWSVRSYAPGDDERVAHLYEEVYGQPMPVERYRWKLLEMPWSLSAPNVWVADAGQRLVGHYAATPLRFKLGNEVLTVGHTGDAMTHPDFRRQGVFSAVAQTAHKAWATAGVPFMVGVPNDQWISRRAPLGYTEQFKLVWFRRPLRLDRLLARRYRLPSLLRRVVTLTGRAWNALWKVPLGRAGEVLVSSVSRPGPAFDALWQELKGHYQALYVRDRAWLTYRYGQAPGYDYHILLAQRSGHPVGYLVYRLTGRNAHIVAWIADLFTAPGDKVARTALLRTAMEAMVAAGAGSVHVLLSPQAPLVSTLRRAGFWRARGEFDASLVRLEQPLPDLSRPEVWFTMTGDYDIV